MNKFNIVWAVLLMGAIAVPVWAAPLAPTLSATSPTAGETTLLRSAGGATTGYVDWMVLPGGSYTGTDFAPLLNSVFGSADIPTGQFLYAYKLESLVDNGSTFSINLTSPDILSMGSFNGDLDAVGHNAANFPNLGAPPPQDFVFTDKKPLVADDGTPVVEGGNITWHFTNDLKAGEESEVLWFTSDNGPTYRPAGMGQGSPVPHAPAPGALLLGILGLVLTNWIKRLIS